MTDKEYDIFINALDKYYPLIQSKDNEINKINASYELLKNKNIYNIDSIIDIINILLEHNDENLIIHFIINKFINNTIYNSFFKLLLSNISVQLKDYYHNYNSIINNTAINKYISQFGCCILYKPKYYKCYYERISFTEKTLINQLNTTYLKQLKMIIDELLTIENTLQQYFHEYYFGIWILNKIYNEEIKVNDKLLYLDNLCYDKIKNFLINRKKVNKLLRRKKYLKEQIQIRENRIKKLIESKNITKYLLIDIDEFFKIIESPERDIIFKKIVNTKLEYNIKSLNINDQILNLIIKIFINNYYDKIINIINNVNLSKVNKDKFNKILDIYKNDITEYIKTRNFNIFMNDTIKLILNEKIKTFEASEQLVNKIDFSNKLLIYFKEYINYNESAFRHISYDSLIQDIINYYRDVVKKISLETNINILSLKKIEAKFVFYFDKYLKRNEKIYNHQRYREIIDKYYFCVDFYKKCYKIMFDIQLTF